MGEKWFQFVSRIKKETGVASLKEAMAIASKRKSEWQRDGQKDGQRDGQKDGQKDGATPKATSGKRKSAKKAKRGTRRVKNLKLNCEVEDNKALA
jgi:hypothetical protein